MTLAQLLNLYRLFKGPSLPDRILALDTMYINAMALFILLGILF
jgi:multicomponent K+:H+ antiporter subunit F